MALKIAEDKSAKMYEEHKLELEKSCEAQSFKISSASETSKSLTIEGAASIHSISQITRGIFLISDCLFFLTILFSQRFFIYNPHPISLDAPTNILFKTTS
jgi:hypothetical protein